MKDVIVDIILTILGIVFIIGIVIGALTLSSKQDEKTWNNGYCECGGHFEYEQAVGHRDRTSYIYRCDSCGKHIELREER